MREIRFRGKRADNGEWVYGCYAEFVNYLDGNTKSGIQVTKQVTSSFNRMIPAFETELLEVDCNTVGQYTGLKDKNGTEIYEGDIVKNKVGIMAEIVYRDYAFVLKYGEDYYYPLGQEVEVIGNIYENPTLREDAK